MKCADINRGFKNGSRRSVDTKPVGDGGGECHSLSFEGIEEYGGNIPLSQLSSNSLPR